MCTCAHACTCVYTHAHTHTTLTMAIKAILFIPAEAVPGSALSYSDHAKGSSRFPVTNDSVGGTCPPRWDRARAERSGEIQPLMWKDRSGTPRGHLALLKFSGRMRNGGRRGAHVGKCTGDTKAADPMAQKAALKDNYWTGGKWALLLQ